MYEKCVKHVRDYFDIVKKESRFDSLFFNNRKRMKIEIASPRVCVLDKETEGGGDDVVVAWLVVECDSVWEVLTKPGIQVDVSCRLPR